MNQAAAPSAASLFSNRFVQAIMLAGLFMQLGIWIRNFAVLLYVVEKTNNDPIALSLVSVVEFAPIFIFSFIGGAFADRWRPKRTMIWCDVLSAISVFVVLFTIINGSWEAVFFTTFVSAILSQFSQPSSMKLFKLHVPEQLLQAGMSIFQTMVALFMVAGPAIGTIIYEQYGIQTSLIITGFLFLLSAVALLFLPADREEEKKEANTSLRYELMEGARYVWNSSILKPLMACFAMAGLAIGLIQPLGILVVTEQLGLPKGHLQYLLMVNGGAMLIGGALAMMMSKRLQPQHMLAIGMAVSSIVLVVIGVSHLWWLTLTAQFLSGLFLPAIQIGINTLILKNTESSFIGRVNGILSPMFMGAMVITMSLAGVAKSVLPLSAMYAISSVLFIIGILSIISILRMRAPVQVEELAGKAAIANTK
ncbi:MFS transporter [Paenibacillus sp. SC116]|uniref:MFS transporter n=1 Tax=Paenibacillus sp. SC116 TaxID=2968986 RepID=UPI00215B70CA|nr:MFS transporter [Paenibacillus sp. SC116]MCR8844693.1 MFS transporter [Paenibacillus sp. SC116]